MRKIKTIIIAAVMLLAAGIGCSAQADAAPIETKAPETVQTVVIETNIKADQAEPTLVFADDALHPALMTLKADGQFHPDRLVTKAELCEFLFPLFDGLTYSGVATFTDLRRGEEGYNAVSALYRAGVLPDAAGEAFNPAQCVTREYLSELLFHIADALGGEDGARVRLLAIDTDAGLTAPEGASVSDSSHISRAEMALVLEELLAREPNGNDLFMNGCLPPDMAMGDYACEYVSDAVTEGAVEPVSESVHRLYGWLYAAWDDGTMIADMDYGVWTFDADGRYTTGSETLDAYIAAALEESGANALSGEKALKAAYLYIKYNFEYIVTPLDTETIPVGVTGWEYERAERFFKYGGGTCYGYAAALCVMARALGYHAYAVAAEINQYYGAHGFVVIPDGEDDLIYDVELEATRPERHADFDLFGILNYDIYNYWYVANWRI